MTRDEMIEKILEEVFDAGWREHAAWLNAPRPDFSTKSSRRDAALAPVRAALRAPAVTGEVYPNSDRGLREMCPGVPVSILRGIQEAAFRAGREDMFTAQVAAPPAAGAPPALAALVPMAQAMIREVYEGHRDPRSNDYNECEKVECNWCVNVTPFLAWSPAPAPVAPPAEMCDALTCRGRVVDGRCVRCGLPPEPSPAPPAVTWFDQHGRQVAPPEKWHHCKAGHGLVCARFQPTGIGCAEDECDLASGVWSPAPPAVAGGDAPETQVGDFVLHAGAWHPVTNPAAWTGLLIDGIERNGVVIWRRRQEGQ